MSRRATGRWDPLVDLAVQILLVAMAWVLVDLLPAREVPERAMGSLSFAAGVAATILMAVAAWMSGNHRARRLAAAVGVYTGVALLMRAVGADPTDAWALAGSVAMTGAIGLLALALRGPSGRPRDRLAALGVLAFVAGGIGAVAAAAWFASGHRPPEALVLGTGVLAWSGVGALGLVLFVAGARTGRPLMRRTGLAFGVLGTAHGVGLTSAPPSLPAVLELGAVAMLLFAAAPFLIDSVRSVGREQARSRTRLAEVEAVMASVAERDHELRNVVAGLAGAAQVLGEDDGGDPDDARLLLQAARAELQRLQQMLDGTRRTPDGTPVGPMLRNLALVQSTLGLDVEVAADEGLAVAVAPDVVAQVLTNLLSNCARHAPGARVRLRAAARGRLVRIEVADDGPGLTGRSVRDVMRRGVRRVGSPGDGLGLGICADLVREHDGVFTLASSPRGCTVAIEWPATRDSAAVEAVPA